MFNVKQCFKVILCCKLIYFYFFFMLIKIQCYAYKTT